MTTFNTIPAGYCLSIKSAENDGNAVTTIIKYGLTEEEVRFYTQFIKLFYTPNGFGNMYQPRPDDLNRFYAKARPVLMANVDVILKEYEHSDAEPWVLKSLEPDVEDLEGIRIITSEYHGELFGMGDFYFRYLKSYKVEFYPEAVQIEDVTSRF